MKNIVIIILSFLFTSLMAQKPLKKDNPQQRIEYEFSRLKNPFTGQIPENIRKLELEFVRSQGSKSLMNFDENTTWNHRGPFNVGGRTRALAVDVNSEDIILAGGVSGGLWRSTDQGSSWNKMTTLSDLQSITCIAQDPRAGQTDTWYYGTGELSGNSASGDGAFFLGDGIFKSTDGGLNWNALSATVSGTPQSFDATFEINNNMVVNPTNGDLVVANFFGIFRSQNGGASFSELQVNTQQGWSDIITTSTGILYSYLEGLGIFKSINNGDTWIDITDVDFPLANGNRVELAVAPSDEDILYAVGEDNTDPSGHTLWKFDDGTDTWTDLSAQIPQLGGDVGDFDSQGGYDLIVAVKLDDPDFVIIGGTNIYRSTDGFTTTGNTDWIGGYSPLNNISLYLNQHPDQHAFIFLSGNKALSGNDGGVQITNDITDVSPNSDGETVDWIWLNNGYLTTQVYALSTGPSDQLMAGFQDNSTWLTTSIDGNTFWTDEFSGDGAYNAFNSDGTERYMSAQNAFIFRVGYPNENSTVASSFTRIDPSTSYSTSLFITPFYLDPMDDNLLYLGGDLDLYVNTQASTATRSVGWKSIDLGVNSGVVSEFGLTNANMVYVGTDRGELYKVENPENATPTVTDITGASFISGVSGANISSIGVNPMDENELVVTFSNYGIVSIFHSDNGGTTWTDISGNLEENVDGTGNGPSARAVRIIGDGREYMVGTSTGLYSTKLLDGASTSWVQEGASVIGNVVINHMMTKDDGTVVVGTHGNGLYSAVVPDSEPPTDITLSNATIAEAEASGTIIGTLAAVDADDTSHTYTLVTGTGDDDNSDFAISSDQLLSSTEFDFETKSMYTIRVQTEDDGGNIYAEAFSIEITDVTAVEDLENVGITMYPNPFKSRLHLEMINEYIGSIEMRLMSLDGKRIIVEKMYQKNAEATRSMLDLSGISTGTYLIQFKLGRDVFTGKLIKE